MRVDTVMSLASMIAAAVTAIAAVRGEWSWVGRARARLELAALFDVVGDERSRSVARAIRADACLVAERSMGSTRHYDNVIMATFVVQAVLLAVAVISGADAVVPAACLVVSAMSVLTGRR